MHVHAVAHVWRPEDNLQALLVRDNLLVLSFHNVGCGIELG